MNRQFAISAAVIFVLAFAFGFLVHGSLLAGDYSRLPPNVMRPSAEMNARMLYMILAHILFALGFTWIYLKGRENKPWLAQGIRYGIAIAILTTIPTYLVYHVIMPIPLDLVIKQIVYDTIVMVILGVVIAWLNR